MNSGMGSRSLVASAAIFVGLGFGLGTAHADPKADVQTKIKEAMESYDLMDYDAAKKLLNQAVAGAKKAKLDKDPVVARAYLDLGIVLAAVPDAEGAKVSFLSAVQIEPKIQIDAAYKSAETTKLLDEARAEAGPGAATPPAGGTPVVDTGPAVDCKSVKGLQHELIDTAKGGAPQTIEAELEPKVNAAKVSVMFRPEGATEFTEAKLTKSGDCKYVGQIPAAGMHGSLVHYYVAAYDAGGKVIVGKGSAGSPNIMELTAGGPPVKAGDGENPLGTAGAASGGGENVGGVGGGVVVGPKKPTRVQIIIAGGTGFGYVTGSTEGGNMVSQCCIGNSLVVVMPELDVYVTPKIAVGAAGRLGFPVDANVDGHATLAPAGLLRLRYSLDNSGEGIRVMGQVGAGIIRNTIKLQSQSGGMDTDIVAQGPLLIGGGVGYMKKLNNVLAFVADFSALAGIAVTKSVGTSVLNSGLTADLSLGLALGF